VGVLINRIVSLAVFSALSLATVPVGAVAAQRAGDEMVPIPAGHFTMGSSADELARNKVPDNFAVLERPAHEVTVPSFLLAKHDVTRGEFAAFVAETRYSAAGCNVWDGITWSMVATASWQNPGFEQSDSHPVVCVNLADVNAYIDWYSKKTGRAYRLPSETEWEYAARAGTTTARYWGDDASTQCTYANGSSLTYARAFPKEPDVERGCSDGYVYTSPAGSFAPNPWGLYDMLGDVWQWTSGCAKHGTDCTIHFYRGGSWYDGPWLLRAATRNGGRAADRYNSVGFRLAL
jgi:formylglycine-generating enzyme